MDGFTIAKDGIDPNLVPKRTLHTGSKIPTIGLGHLDLTGFHMNK
jgi:hypothetical protein